MSINLRLMPGDSFIIFKSSGEKITTFKLPNNSPILLIFIELTLIAFFPSLRIFISILLSKRSLPILKLIYAPSSSQLINSLSLEVLCDLANPQ